MTTNSACRYHGIHSHNPTGVYVEANRDTQPTKSFHHNPMVWYVRALWGCHEGQWYTTHIPATTAEPPADLYLVAESITQTVNARCGLNAWRFVDTTPEAAL